MNKETKIAKENVGQSSLLIKRYPKPKINKEHFGALIKGAKLMGSMKLHKQTCQRWSNYLEKDMANFMNLNGNCYETMCKKIKDLKQAIKLYDDEGI